jgi:hypothetical protein
MQTDASSAATVLSRKKFCPSDRRRRSRADRCATAADREEGVHAGQYTATLFQAGSDRRLYRRAATADGSGGEVSFDPLNRKSDEVTRREEVEVGLAGDMPAANPGSQRLSNDYLECVDFSGDDLLVRERAV